MIAYLKGADALEWQVQEQMATKLSESAALQSWTNDWIVNTMIEGNWRTRKHLAHMFYFIQTWCRQQCTECKLTNSDFDDILRRLEEGILKELSLREEVEILKKQVAALIDNLNKVPPTK